MSDVFGTIRRFHVFDHAAEEWILSGVDFGDKGVVIDHSHERDIESYDNPEVIVAGQDELQLVYEDDDETVQEHELNSEIAIEIDECIRAAVASDAGVDPELVKPISLKHDTVKYILQ